MSVITISRQFGAGGRTLAENVGQRLGYEIAHEGVIEKIAEKAKVSAEVIRSFESEAKGLLRRASDLLSPQNFVGRILEPKRNYMDGELYIDLLRRIIPEVADQGNIIILGRGAQFILKGRPDTYHVLLVASRDDRIRFMQEHYGLTSSKAVEAVAKQGKRREKLMRLFNLGDYDNPTHYDLVLNLSKVGMDQSVDLVCEMVEGMRTAAA